MVEEGIVTQTSGKTAIVLVDRKSACGQCHARGYCQMTEADKLEVSARNEIGATEGQEVIIEIPDEAGLAASSLAYLVPTVLFIAGVILGRAVSGSALAGVLFGFAGIALGLAFASVVWKRLWQDRSRPTITSILD